MLSSLYVVEGTYMVNCMVPVSYGQLLQAGVAARMHPVLLGQHVDGVPRFLKSFKQRLPEIFVGGGCRKHGWGQLSMTRADVLSNFMGTRVAGSSACAASSTIRASKATCSEAVQVLLRDARYPADDESVLN